MARSHVRANTEALHHTSPEPVKPFSQKLMDVEQEAGAAAQSIDAIRARLWDVAEIGRGQGTEALLVCPAPEELADDKISVVIAARFGDALDEETLFWRQHSLADEFHHALNVEALVLDLDASLDELLSHIAPLLASPYRDELGRRDGAGPHRQN
jgi:hypothetical protein